MPKIARLIEYQQDRQRTPSEAIEFLKDKVASGAVKKMVCIYTDDQTIGYVPASEHRDYKNSAILWDFEQWKRWFIAEED